MKALFLLKRHVPPPHQSHCMLSRRRLPCVRMTHIPIICSACADVRCKVCIPWGSWGRASNRHSTGSDPPRGLSSLPGSPGSRRCGSFIQVFFMGLSATLYIRRDAESYRRLSWLLPGAQPAAGAWYQIPPCLLGIAPGRSSRCMMHHLQLPYHSAQGSSTAVQGLLYDQ